MSNPAKTSVSIANNRILSLNGHFKKSSNIEGDFQKSKEASSYKFQGWMGLDNECAEGNMVWREYEPKAWTEDDVDIKITHCGICASDLHTLRSEWVPTKYPACVGHEITGTAVKVGKNVKHIKLGDRCGVGGQSSACLKPDCEECASGLENYCAQWVETFNGTYPDGNKCYGGYADYCRTPSHFVIKIPDGLSLAEAASMLCAGITSWTSLVNNGAGPGKRVGIVGIGGLGHFGLLWAKALGCNEVVAISRSSAKKADAEKMGASRFIATEEDSEWVKKNSRSLDLIVCTISSPKMPIKGYLRLLKIKGEFVQVGLPEDDIPAFSMKPLLIKGVKLGGSFFGTPKEISEMLEFAAKNQVHPFIEERPLTEANQAIVDMDSGKARYRYVLVNEKHVKELKQ
ncbi:hypothetical protein DSL72_002880 [Monilinia vaccinii-corymbosi]|uniref:alcohol dehydrogenase (NADP(+)) n=1 Tax=Monilinia vaccinii-corymbosi TaxID=61207 RepID=A0A8A3PDM9_9HELO|nr:hypothetical protein DSL72_002880 [Monilinia vaccinii-corymbosi]